MPIILPESPDKYKLNKQKRRYKKIKTKNISIKKKTKRKTNTRKRCPKGTRKNKKTKECEKIIVLMDNTPKELTELRKTVTKMGKKHNPKTPHSFRPNVNQVIHSLKSISPHVELGYDMCDDDKIFIKNGKKGKCYGLKSKIAQTYMIDNLLSKKPLDCQTIIAPKQQLSNCWFNAFFVIYFISDKGRKFFRFLRMAMITGMLPNGTIVAPRLRMPLLLLNKYVEASLIGSRSIEPSLATLMDTNRVLRKVTSALGETTRKKLDIDKTRQAGNPYSFYSGLITYLKSDPLTFIKVTVRHATSKVKLKSNIQHILNNVDNDKELRGPQGPLDYFILERFSENYPKKSWTIPKKFKIKYKDEEHTYILDSAVLMDIDKVHFSAYITCNGKSFGFDGESFARMTPFEWKKKMNKDVKWRFAKQYETYFNFQQGYYMLFYYRV